MSDASRQLMCKVIGWEITTLKDCSQFIKDGTHGTHKRVTNGIPLLSAKNITKSGKVEWNSSDSRVSEVDYQKIHSKYSLQKDDLLLTVVGTLGRRALVPVCVKFTIQRSIGVIRTNNEELLPSFLYHYCDTEAFQKQLELRSNATAQAGVYLGELAKIPLPLPPLPEQQKIAAILTSVDEVIEKTQAQINKLKDLKTGMMQELLTRGVGVDGKPHTEFKDSPVGRIPKAWEVVKFKDIFHDYKYGPRFSSKDYDILGNVKTIRGTDLSSNGVIKYKQVPIAKLEKKLVEQNSLQDGDLVMITTADCGATAVFESQDLPYIASAYAIKLTPKEGLNSKYINYFMQTSDALSQVDSFIRKGTVANLPGSDVMSIILALPSKDEQNNIVLILEQLDKRIALKENALKSKSYLKKALMQDLLTGKVRVKVDS